MLVAESVAKLEYPAFAVGEVLKRASQGFIGQDLHGAKPVSPVPAASSRIVWPGSSRNAVSISSETARDASHIAPRAPSNSQVSAADHRCSRICTSDADAPHEDYRAAVIAGVVVREPTSPSSLTADAAMGPPRGFRRTSFHAPPGARPAAASRDLTAPSGRQAPEAEAAARWPRVATKRERVARRRLRFRPAEREVSAQGAAGATNDAAAGHISARSRHKRVERRDRGASSCSSSQP